MNLAPHFSQCSFADRKTQVPLSNRRHRRSHEAHRRKILRPSLPLPTPSPLTPPQTVNPSAINEPLDVFTKNRRNGPSSPSSPYSELTRWAVTLLSMPAAGSTPVDVAFVSIGAMLVGSITETVKQGDFVRRGEEVGYFGAFVLPRGIARS